MLGGSPSTSSAADQVLIGDPITPVRSKVVGRPPKYKLRPTAIINKARKTRNRQTHQFDQTRTRSRGKPTSDVCNVTKEKTSFRLDLKEGVFGDSFKFPKEVTFTHSDVRAFWIIFQCLLHPTYIVGLIVEQSNLYMAQKCGTKIKSGDIITEEDIIKFLAIEVLHSYCPLKAYRDNWDKKFASDPVRQIMSSVRYEHIRKYLNIADNSSIVEGDGFKVRQFVELFLANCQRVENEKFQSIDEMMVPYRVSIQSIQSGCETKTVYAIQAHEVGTKVFCTIRTEWLYVRFHYV